MCGVDSAQLHKKLTASETPIFATKTDEQQTTTLQTNQGQPFHSLEQTKERLRRSLPEPGVSPAEAERLRALEVPAYQPVPQEQLDKIKKEKNRIKAENKNRAAYEKAYGAKKAQYDALRAAVERRLIAERSMSIEDRTRLIEQEVEAKLREDANNPEMVARKQKQEKIAELTKDLPPIDATAEAMEASFQENLQKKEQLSEIALRSMNAWKKPGLAFNRDSICSTPAMDIYAATGCGYLRMNTALREEQKVGDLDQKKDGDIFRMYAVQLRNGMKSAHIPHDIVVRRGAGMDALAGMLGTTDVKQAKQMVQQHVTDKKEMVLTEKGFCSTATMPNTGFGGQLELIILVRKGSQGINLGGAGHGKQDEMELLLGPGTKFRLVDAKQGDKGQTKVYLETFPEETESVESKNYREVWDAVLQQRGVQ